MNRTWLYLSVKIHGYIRFPLRDRIRLLFADLRFRYFALKKFGLPLNIDVLKNALIQPFVDLLNRPSGGDAYCGGVLFKDNLPLPSLRHFRGRKTIDRPLFKPVDSNIVPVHISTRQFWCGPVVFHFGHQIADFGSRILLSSVDPRPGELLWCPWRVGTSFDEFEPWLRFLLQYLNPGLKPHRIVDYPIIASELIVYPQQARMRAHPTPAHLDALAWCERSLFPCQGGPVYVSRAKFASCVDEHSLIGAFAGEAFFERLLSYRGFRVVHPETISLEEQLQIYLGSSLLIFAEGSAQHALELLGYHPNKHVFIICRRPQLPEMAYPLLSRFPKTMFISAIVSQWIAFGGVPWNGISLLDWTIVCNAINPYLDKPISFHECTQLLQISEKQLQSLCNSVQLHKLQT